MMSSQHAPGAPGRCVLVLALAVGLGGCAARVPPPPPPAGPLIFAVVTWNMHVGRGDLSRLAADLATGRLTDGRPIADYVLLLQEAVEGSANDVEALADAQNLSAVFGPVRTYDDRPSGNAILSTLPLEDVRAIDLPRARQRRGAVTASVTVAGTRLFVVSTHLENRLGLLGGIVFADTARHRQADALLAELPANGYGIAGGDMNSLLGLREPALLALARRFDDTPPDPTGPTFRGRLVLDHLFFDLPPGWEARRLVSPDRYGSDHHPVIGLIHGRF